MRTLQRCTGSRANIFDSFVLFAILNVTNFLGSGGGLIAEKILLQQGKRFRDKRQHGTAPTPSWLSLRF